MQFQRFDEIRIPDQRAVRNLDILKLALPDSRNALATGFECFLGTEHGRVFLHGALHLVARNRRGVEPEAKRMRSKRSMILSQAALFSAGTGSLLLMT